MKQKRFPHRITGFSRQLAAVMAAAMIVGSFPGINGFAEELTLAEAEVPEESTSEGYSEEIPQAAPGEWSEVPESGNMDTQTGEEAADDLQEYAGETEYATEAEEDESALVGDEDIFVDEEVFFEEELFDETYDAWAEEALTESEETFPDEVWDMEEESTEQAQELGEAKTEGTTGNCTWRVQDTNTLYIQGKGVAYPTQMSRIDPADIKGYENITKIVVGGGINAIGDGMFTDYKNIVTVQIYSTIPRIGARAFKGCTALKTVTSTNVQYIGDEAFAGCTLLEGIPSQYLLEIGKGAFADCTSLKSDSIHFEKVTKIGDRAFSGCKKISMVNAPALEEIGWRAFYNCTELTAASVGSTLQKIGPQAFMNCEKLTGVLGWNNVTDIRFGAFTNCNGLTSVMLPSKLKTLGTLAFLQCKNLETVSMGNEITTIEDGAFAGCIKLADITLPQSITSLGSIQKKIDASTGYESNVTMWEHTEKNGVFSRCDSLLKVTVPSKVTELAGSLFFDSGVREVVLPDGITSVGTRVFEGSDLEKINWPGGVPVISSNTFKYCTKLKEVILGEGVKEIGMQVFDNCQMLEKLVFPTTLEKIGTSAFDGCINLKEADLSKTKLTAVPDRAFTGCTALTKVALPDTVQTTGVRAFSGTGIKSFTGPKSLKTVGNLSFYDCPSLETLDLQYVQIFEANAVGNCPKLSSLDISNRITTVTDKSFVSNKKEKTVTFHGKKSEFDKITNLSKNTDLLSGKIIYTVPEETEVDVLEAKVLGMTGSEDLPEATFAPLCAAVSRTRAASITLRWTKVKDATGYIVYGAKRRKEAYKKLGELPGTAVKYTHKGLKKNTFYKYIVIAVSAAGSDKKVAAVSKTVLVATRGGKYRNVTSVKSGTKKKITLEKGKKQKLQPVIVSKISVGRKLMTLRKTGFESSDPTVAKVTAKGRIRAVGKGSCTIYIYAQNGVYISVKIRVS